MEPRIYLASRSPRRRELLTQIGVPFNLLLFRTAPRFDEAVDESPLPNEKVEDYVVRVARAKAEFGQSLVVSRHLRPAPVLAADTTVELDGRIYGKPLDAADAEKTLRAFSGRSHRVLTTVAIAWNGRVEHRLNINEVRFRELTDAEIKHYVHSGEPMDKAGAYGIQGFAAMFVAEMRGEHSGIVGLPLCETTMLLRDIGYPI
ncbi:MAG: Maf family nucleotide pyrophosphatase [Rhodocyclaceae bacterium]|nr:Maf family nucleotide pyrophosphatase [Rhodocyclaceae bacterium]